MFAIYSSVWMYCIFMAPLWTMSLIKWYFNSICLDLSWKTRFFVSFKQRWLSQWIIVVSNLSWNKPDNSFLSHTASLLTSLAAIYFASAVLCAIEPCFLLEQDIMVEPKSWNSNLKYSFDPLSFRPNLNQHTHEATVHHWKCIWVWMQQTLSNTWAHV